MYAGPSDQVCELLPSTEEKGQSRKAQPSMILCSGSDLPSKSLTAHAHHTLMESGLTGPGNARMAKAGLWAFPFSAKIVYRALGGVWGEIAELPSLLFRKVTHTHTCAGTPHIYIHIPHTHRINTHTLHIHTSTHHTCTYKHTTYMCMYTTYIHMLLTHTIQTCISHKYIDQHTTHVYKHMPHTTHIHIHTYRNTA